MRIRIPLLLVALVFPVVLFAQSPSNELGVFINRTSFHSTSETDPDLGITAKFKIDSKTGYGLTFDHFFSPNLSLQLAAQSVRGDSKISISGGGPTFSVDTGSIDLTQYDAALHWYFGSSPTIRPYAGLGLGRTHGGTVKVPAELTESGVEERFKLDDKFGWIADAGVDFRVTPKGSIAVSAKYVPYKTKVDNDPSVERVKLDPLTISAGFRWRF